MLSISVFDIWGINLVVDRLHYHIEFEGGIDDKLFFCVFEYIEKLAEYLAC